MSRDMKKRVALPPLDVRDEDTVKRYRRVQQIPLKLSSPQSPLSCILDLSARTFHVLTPTIVTGQRG